MPNRQIKQQMQFFLYLDVALLIKLIQQATKKSLRLFSSPLPVKVGTSSPMSEQMLDRHSFNAGHDCTNLR